MAKPLSTRQKTILDFIRNHIAQHGYPPTVREIGEAVDLSSSSTVHAHLKSLEERGHIQRDAVLTRAIKVVGQAPSDNAPVHNPKTGMRVRNFPIIGTVAAGKPRLAVEDIEDYFPLPEDFVNGDGFILRVRGDSMIDDGIRNGDFVVVRRQQTANDGDTVVALIDSEATVKRLYREKNRIRLQPANQAMKPIFSQSADVLGKVVGVVRRLS